MRTFSAARTCRTLSSQERGITLLEIMAALLILAFAFIPLVGVIGTGTSDTDVTNSYIFAQTAARSILENLLDSVPFECVHLEPGTVADLDGSNAEDHVARFTDTPSYQVASFLALLGNKTDQLGRGTLTDSRGTSYAVKLLIFPVEGLDTNIPDPTQELVLTYLPRPLFEQANVGGHPAWYTSDEFVPPGVNRPYDYELNPIQTNARNLGVPFGTNASERYCMMKRFLLRIRWRMPPNRERFLEVYTAKANLSRVD
jgi:hypothetical protein